MLPLPSGVSRKDAIMEADPLEVMPLSQSATLADLLRDGYQFAISAAVDWILGRQMHFWHLAARDAGVQVPKLLLLPSWPVLAGSAEVLGAPHLYNHRLLVAPAEEFEKLLRVAATIAVYAPGTGFYQKTLRQRLNISDVLQLSKHPARSLAAADRFQIDVLGVIHRYGACAYCQSERHGLLYAKLVYHPDVGDGRLLPIISRLLAGDSDPYGATDLATNRKNHSQDPDLSGGTDVCAGQ